MSRKFALMILSILTIGTFFTSSISAATLLVEDFNDAAGTAITTANWVAHSGAGTNPLVTSAPSLTLAGYPSSGVGNAVTLATTGEDANRVFAVQSSGSVYAAFMVTVSEASVDPAGGYFFHLGPDPVGTTFRGRVFAKKDASNNVAFGISKAATAVADIVYTPFTYSLNTTYLIVVKYTIVDGATNDTVSMIVSTTVPAVEPAATVTATDIATQSDVNPGTVAIRQGATATSPTVRVDGIRVGNTWADVTQPVVAADAPVDFNGDGRTDFIVVRADGGALSEFMGVNDNTGKDKVRNMERHSLKQESSLAPQAGTGFWTLLNDGTGGVRRSFGNDTDFFMVEDVIGDSKDDLIVWTPGAATVASFKIFDSGTFTVTTIPYGQTGDDPTILGDFSGDGKGDIAVYRDGTAGSPQSFFFWSTTAAPATINYIPWGTDGDVAYQLDYDGDGRIDPAVQRNGGGGVGHHWIRQSSNGATVFVSYGLSSDFVIPGDYDGDGRDDIMVSRNANLGDGTLKYFWLRESDGGVTPQPTFQWGISGDFICQGDYDGDGKTDVGIWRSNADPLQNFFYIRQSSNGALKAQEWGQSGDYPVNNWNVH